MANITGMTSTIDATPTMAAARRLQQVMTVGMGLLLAVALVALFLSAQAPIDVARNIVQQGGYASAPLEAWQAWTLIAIGAVHGLVWFALLAKARSLFRHLSSGHLRAAASTARTMARLLWGLLAWGLFSQLIASATATWTLPQGERVLSIALGTPQVSVAFSALIASFLAHAFVLGAELWDDHKEVI